MRRQTYYVIAALLVLATLPMYRYIFSRARERDHSGSVSASRLIRPSPAEESRLSSHSHTPLLAGEVCKDGRVLLADGIGYSVARGPSGAIVPCNGRYLLTSGNSAFEGLTQRVRKEKIWYAYGEKLPDGYKCSAVDGPVYRTRVENRWTVIEPLVRDGMIVRCGGPLGSSR